MTSVNISMHCTRSLYRKLNYKAYQGLIELSALTLGCREECSEMSDF